MIVKPHLFIDRNIQWASPESFSKAQALVFHLFEIATQASFFPTHNLWKRDLGPNLNDYLRNNYQLNNKEHNLLLLVMGFSGAISKTHRLEASLKVEDGCVQKKGAENSITMRLKFYEKNKKVDFYVWTMVFNNTGEILIASYH